MKLKKDKKINQEKQVEDVTLEEKNNVIDDTSSIDDSIDNLSKKLCSLYEQKILEEEEREKREANIEVQPVEEKVEEVKNEIKEENLETTNEVENNIKEDTEIGKEKQEEINTENTENKEETENQKKENIFKKIEENNKQNKIESNVENSVKNENIKPKENNKLIEREKIKKERRLIYPEEVEVAFLNWFDENKKLAFLTSLIIGIITNINLLQELYTGAIAIILVALSSMVIVDILKLRTKHLNILATTCFTIVFLLIGKVAYNHMFVMYYMSTFFAVLTAKLILKNRNQISNSLLAMITFGISFCLYQSNIGIVFGLVFIKLFKDSFKNTSAKVCIDSLLKLFVVCLIVLLVCFEIHYFGLINYSFLNFENIISNPEQAITNSFTEFYNFFFTDNMLKNFIYYRDILYLVFFACVIILECMTVVQRRIYNDPFKICSIIIINLILPIALNMILLISNIENLSILSSIQMILIIPFASVICEVARKRYTSILKWSLIFCMLLIICTYYMEINNYMY